MSVTEGKELRIIGFLCNWCSYAGDRKSVV